MPSISVVIPAYNEERRLPPSLERVVNYFSVSRFDPVEILVINDGSKDRTHEIAEKAAAELNNDRCSIQVLDNPGNRGKGYSVRHGMLAASNEWVLFSDADLSAPIEETEKLFASAQQGGHDGAIGSRALDRSLVGVHQSLFREYSGRMFNLAVRLVTGLSYADTQCGFKLFSREAAQQIFKRQQMERFGFDVEILFIARKLGLSVVETPVRWNDVEGTKVSTLSGADAFLDIVRVRRNDLKGKYE